MNRNINRNILYPSGTRGYLYVAKIPGDTALPIYRDGINYIPRWGRANDFKQKPFEYITPFLKYIPCNSVDFTVGEKFYTSTGDGVPSVIRVKPEPVGSYKFDFNFPIIITKNSDDENDVKSVYDDVVNFCKHIGQKLSFSTSIRHLDNMLPTLLESFYIFTEGTSESSETNCSMKVVGISPNKLQTSAMRAMSGLYGGIVDNSVQNLFFKNSLKDGGRAANIKDCIVTFGDDDIEDIIGSYKTVQLVGVNLEVRQSFSLNNTANKLNDRIYPPKMFTINNIGIKSRDVTGSITMIASSLARNQIPYDPYSHKRAERGLNFGQRSSPLYINFGGGFEFMLPSTYWQPEVYNINAGKSAFIKINFIARSPSATGLTEFGESPYADNDSSL